jgi:hypothetical protein
MNGPFRSLSGTDHFVFGPCYGRLLQCCQGLCYGPCCGRVAGRGWIVVLLPMSDPRERVFP